MAHHAGGVDGRRRGPQRVQVVGEALETVRTAFVQQVQGGGRVGVRQRRQADAAIARDHRGDALRDLGRHVAAPEQVVVVVGVRVDEAGRDHQARHVDPGVRGGVRQIADGGDAVAAHAQVGAPSRGVAAVDEGAAHEQQVEGLGIGLGHGNLRRGDQVAIKWRNGRRPAGRSRPGGRWGFPGRSAPGPADNGCGRHSRTAAPAGWESRP